MTEIIELQAQTIAWQYFQLKALRAENEALRKRLQTGKLNRAPRKKQKAGYTYA